MSSKDSGSSNATNTNTSLNQSRSPASGHSASGATDKPGGLFGYIQSRKKVQQIHNLNQATTAATNPRSRRKTEIKYHELANGATNYLLDFMSDSDDDEPLRRDDAMSPPPIFDTPSMSNAGMANESWLSRFQKSSTNHDSINKSAEIEESSSSSWMSQALKTVDDATTKASDWLSNQTDSTRNSALSSIASYVPSISWLPFSKDNTGGLPTIHEDTPELNNTRRFLPKMASRSRLSFATNGRNPFQAVIGRDADLLSSNTSYFWNPANSWLSWIKNKTMRLIEATDETYYKTIERPKSQPSEASLQAVKNLLLLVETEASELKRLQINSSDASSHPSTETSCHHDLPPIEEDLSFDSCISEYGSTSSPVRSSPVRPESSSENDNTREYGKMGSDPNNARNAEMASRLAEGTLRAYRDLVLDEAVELHSALHHWTLRWERPFLGWLEAGPRVWISEEGHSPYEAAKKMSQIQAVLARRCASIGEIQEHLMRATWTKGVANWGMLGTLHGGEWVSVVGGDGGMDDMGFSKRKTIKGRSSIQIFDHPSLVGSNVTNAPGGRIVIDEDAQVIWSIDAMRVVRDQLYRASLGEQALPHTSNWPREARHFSIVPNKLTNNDDLPTWADVTSSFDAARAAANSAVATSSSTDGDGQQTESDIKTQGSIVISNLPKMSQEVASLLEAIEINLYQQRNRRLDKLRPRSRWRRNWYLFAIGIPATLYMGHKLTKEHGGFFLLKQVFKTVADIYRDHVSEPLYSIYQELVKGRLDVTDRKARLDAIESLKRMIRAWLDENHPQMKSEERASLAEAMDISLIEQHMEESIKYIYEAPALMRMSMIEMQFIKKELLSALVAMDELMGSNEMNMQVAAMTPAVIFFMAVRRTFSWLFYSVVKEGKSKDDVYATLRQIILDIERLLTMRDSPPPPPDSLYWGSHSRPSTTSDREDVRTLSADDLGMLLLHIHECRQIISQNSRRFRDGLLRNLTEDLAELAGERGPVSLKQQLHIVKRMSRVYLFMKPRSKFVTKI